MSFEFFSELFRIDSIQCAGIDGLICKVQLTAAREGRLDHAFVGVPLVVKKRDESEEVVIEIKRSGLHIDRFVDLELRIGDRLIFYVSRASA